MMAENIIDLSYIAEDKIKPRIELICRDNLRKLLDEAKRAGKTPTELLYDEVEDAVYSGSQFNELLKEEERKCS